MEKGSKSCVPRVLVWTQMNLISYSEPVNSDNITSEIIMALPTVQGSLETQLQI